MLASLLQQGTSFLRPDVDFHAFAPEIVLVGAIVVVLLVDLFTPEGSRGIVPQVAGLGLLAAMVPVLTLALDGTDRVMFGGAYAVDNFSLVLKALFLLAGYVVVLLSTNYIAEGDYAEGEYYFLLLSSILGMTVMASSRDLVSIFVALELLSIPAYMLAGWRKARPQGQRGRGEVLPDGRVRVGRDALRHVAALRPGRQHPAHRHRRRSQRRQHPAVRHAGRDPRRGRLRLQGVGCAVPHLGTRHLRGRAHADHGLPRRQLQGGRLRRPAPAHPDRLHRPRRRRRPAHVGAGRASR